LGVEPPAKTCKLPETAKPLVLCCHPANTNEELGGLASPIPSFAKLFCFQVCISVRKSVKKEKKTMSANNDE